MILLPPIQFAIYLPITHYLSNINLSVSQPRFDTAEFVITQQEQQPFYRRFNQLTLFSYLENMTSAPMTQRNAEEENENYNDHPGCAFSTCGINCSAFDSPYPAH